MTLRPHPRPCLALLVALLPGLSGCEDDPYTPDCELPYDAQDMAGYWELSGEGDRVQCADPALDGNLDLNFATPILVRVGRAQDAADAAVDDADAGLPEGFSEADAFVERIAAGEEEEPAFDAYEISSSQDDGFLTGTTTGSCVDFVIEEELAGEYDMHSVSFSGSMRDSRTIKGRFQGTGPGACRIDGKFEIYVR